MKFGTKLWYDKVYCVTKNQPHIAYASLYFFIFLSPTKIYVTDFAAPVEARVFRFCIHLEGGQVICVEENQGANIYFAFFFIFFLPSLLCNAYGHFPSKISQELLDLGLLNLVQSFGRKVARCCNKESATYCLSVHLFLHFSFSPNKFLL